MGCKSRGMIYAMRSEMAEYISVFTSYGGSSGRRIMGNLMADQPVR